MTQDNNIDSQGNNVGDLSQFGVLLNQQLHDDHVQSASHNEYCRPHPYNVQYMTKNNCQHGVSDNVYTLSLPSSCGHNIILR